MGMGFVDVHRREWGEEDGKKNCAFVKSHLQLLEEGIISRVVLSAPSLCREGMPLMRQPLAAADLV